MDDCRTTSGQAKNCNGSERRDMRQDAGQPCITDTTVLIQLPIRENPLAFPNAGRLQSAGAGCPLA